MNLNCFWIFFKIFFFKTIWYIFYNSSRYNFEDIFFISTLDIKLIFVLFNNQQTFRILNKNFRTEKKNGIKCYMIWECFNEVWLSIVQITNKMSKEYFINDIGGILYFESGKLQFVFIETHLLGKRLQQNLSTLLQKS